MTSDGPLNVRLAEGAQAAWGSVPMATGPRNRAGDGLQRDVLGTVLLAEANFTTTPSGVDFDRLPAGVGVDLGVEHQHVHVAPLSGHVAKAPIVAGPPSRPNDPHTARTR